MHTEPVSVYASHKEYEAQAVLDMLLQEGLSAYPFSRADPSSVGMGNLTMGSGIDVAQFEVFVEPQQEERALELVGGFLGTLAMLEELTLEELEGAALAESDERQSE